MKQSAALRGWNRLQGSGFGRWLFSRAVCWRAPYFRSIKPTFLELAPGHAVVTMSKRWRVTNHIGTVHAIAIANLCEIAAGTMTEVSVPPGMRWIPKGMTIRYLAKAESGVTATAALPAISAGESHDAVVAVDVHDRDGNTVVHADITMYVSPKRNR